MESEDEVATYYVVLMKKSIFILLLMLINISSVWSYVGGGSEAVPILDKESSPAGITDYLVALYFLLVIVIFPLWLIINYGIWGFIWYLIALFSLYLFFTYTPILNQFVGALLGM